MNDLSLSGDALVAIDQRHMIHPLHHAQDHAKPKLFVSAQGSMLRTADGKEYIDGLSALWNVNIGHGRKELAAAAAKQMETLVPPRGIVVRASSDDLVINDQLVARASRLMREGAGSGITVDEVCRRLNASRSTLERRMKASLGRSPKEEIQRLRFRVVERLLSDTDLTIDAIAEQTGFTHGHYFQSAFRERYGETPGMFRRKANPKTDQADS